MKKFFLIAVMAVISLSASAQKMRHSAGSITIQPMIGISTGYLRGEYKSGSTTIKYENDEARTGLGIGAEAEYYTTTPWLSVSAALLYQQQGWEMKSASAYKCDYINIPVLANFYVAPNFALKIGIQPAIPVSAKEKNDKIEIDVKDAMQSVTFDVPIGASYEYSNFVFDARYNLGIAKINKGNGSVRNSVIQITVGYKIPL